MNTNFHLIVELGVTAVRRQLARKQWCYYHVIAIYYNGNGTIGSTARWPDSLGLHALAKFCRE